MPGRVPPQRLAVLAYCCAGAAARVALAVQRRSRALGRHGSGLRGPAATRERSTSTCRSSTGASASRTPCGCRPGCRSTCAPSTARRPSGWPAERSRDVDAVRSRGRGAIEDCHPYARAVAAAAALALGLLMALALRARRVPLRLLVGAAVVGALACAAAIAVPARAPARRVRRPRVLRQRPGHPGGAARASTRPRPRRRRSREELNAQLVGLARLIALPAERGARARCRRLTLASDLHNNLLALPDARARGARGAALLRR